MDPVALLNEIRASISEGDFAQAHEELDAYATWRFRGGVAPEDGDVRALRFAAIILDQCSGSPDLAHGVWSNIRSIATAAQITCESAMVAELPEEEGA